jgi:hypothetical protein
MYHVIEITTPFPFRGAHEFPTLGHLVERGLQRSTGETGIDDEDPELEIAGARRSIGAVARRYAYNLRGRRGVTAAELAEGLECRISTT